MSLNMDRQNIIQLISMLPEKELFAVEMFVKFISTQIEDPVVRMLLTAPIDEEPLTEEEKAASEANWQAYLRGEGRPFEELAKELCDGE